MIEDNRQKHNINKISDEPEFKIRQIFGNYLSKWYWYVLLLMFSLFLAYTYLRYSTPIYKVNSEIIIKDDKGSGLSSQNILSELDIFNTKSNAVDEIEILKTQFLMEKVVNELQLDIGYYEVGKIKNTELYKRSPFTVKLLTNRDSITAQKFQIRSQGNGFVISSDSSKISHGFGDTFSLGKLSLVVEKKPSRQLLGDYLVTVVPSRLATATYLNSVSIGLVNKQTNVIEWDPLESTCRHASLSIL